MSNSNWHIPLTDDIRAVMSECGRCERQIKDVMIEDIGNLSEFASLVTAELHEGIANGRKFKSDNVSSIRGKYLEMAFLLDEISKELGYGVSVFSNHKCCAYQTGDGE